MKNKILILFILGYFGTAEISAQHKQPLHAIDYSKLSINGITISKAIVDSIQIQTNKKFEPLKFYHWKDSIIDTTNYGYWDIAWHGIFIKNIDKGLAYSILEKYSNKIFTDGNYIYLTNFILEFGIPTAGFYDIAIIKASTQFDAVKLVGTSSSNYDIENNEVIGKLKKWDTEFGLKITVIDKNKIRANILTKPKDLERLAQEIDEISPDSKNYYGSLEAMIENCLKQNKLLLWWE